MTKVIHTADTHVGYQQYHSPTRRQDFLDAFRQVVEDAVDDDVAAVVHGGDLFHDRRPELPDLLGVLDALRTLEEAGIPFLAIVGNHEATRSGQWLDLFTSLGLATRLDDAPTVVGDVAFYGLDHVPKSRRDDLDYSFEPHDARHAALVAHGLFQPFSHGEWDTEQVIRESEVDFDALLLGDNHTPDTAQMLDTWVTYPGSTERASTNERGARGYNLVEFGDDPEIRRRSLDTREFVFVTADLAPGEGTERVRERVRENDVEDAVVIIEIEGEGESVTPATIEEYATEQGALIARVTDRRDRSGDEELSTDFADPDAAVRERVDELELSELGRSIDETVRSTGVADSNVRTEVKRRVESRLEAGDLTDALMGGSDGGSQASDRDGAAGATTRDTTANAEAEQEASDGPSEQLSLEDST